LLQTQALGAGLKGGWSAVENGGTNSACPIRVFISNARSRRTLLQAITLIGPGIWMEQGKELGSPTLIRAVDCFSTNGISLA
jgi:hypothetical protein